MTYQGVYTDMFVVMIIIYLVLFLHRASTIVCIDDELDWFMKTYLVSITIPQHATLFAQMY